jgi:uncharacterized GH25 family protein
MMRSNKLATLAVTVTVIAFAGLAALKAQAHSAFLVPSSTVLSKPQWVTIDGGVGNEMFYFNHNALRLDNVSVTGPDGAKVQMENVMTGKVRSTFDINLTQPGTYRVSNAFAGINARYKDATGAQKGWRGTAATFEKEVPADAADLRLTESSTRLETFVTVGKPTPVATTGVGLEFVPVTHPNDLYNGEKVTFGFTIDGKPAEGLSVEIVPGGGRYRDKVGDYTVKTDAKGQITLTFAEPGMYRMEVSGKDDKTSLKQIKERRLVYAAVLEVLAQ